MISLLWDGTGIYKKDNKIVTAPGECCCCENSCSIPTDFGITNSGCSGIIWAQCSGDGCWNHSFSGCLSNIPSALTEQGYHILYNDDCCNCGGFILWDVFGCCSGVIDDTGENDLLIPANVVNDCELCNPVETISLEQISGEYFWRIPRCTTETEYYCILEE